MTIGIFGGTFNPIHIGHAILANFISQTKLVDEVWLMPTPHNPLKSEGNTNYDRHRIEMAQIVAEGCANVQVCLEEFELPRPSYSYDTLVHLKNKFPEHEFKMIIGADNWLCFDKWRNYQSIISEFGLIVYPRPGYSLPEDSGSTNVIFIDAPQIEISSTSIREGLKRGMNMNFFLSEKVYHYILEQKLYQE